jgi:hypothetical protein
MNNQTEIETLTKKLGVRVSIENCKIQERREYNQAICCINLEPFGKKSSIRKENTSKDETGVPFKIFTYVGIRGKGAYSLLHENESSHHFPTGYPWRKVKQLGLNRKCICTKIVDGKEVQILEPMGPNVDYDECVTTYDNYIDADEFATLKRLINLIIVDGAAKLLNIDSEVLLEYLTNPSWPIRPGRSK